MTCNGGQMHPVRFCFSRAGDSKEANGRSTKFENRHA